MRRGHRRAHSLLWPAIGVLVAAGFSLALAWRPPPEPSRAEQPMDTARPP